MTLPLLFLVAVLAIIGKFQANALHVALHYDLKQMLTASDCNLVSIELVNTKEIIPMKELSGQLFPKHDRSSSSSPASCIYQQRDSNVSRIVAFSIENHHLRGWIAIGQDSYHAHNVVLSKLSGEIIQLKVPIGWTQQMKHSCGVKTPTERVHTDEWNVLAASKELDYVNASINNYYLELHVIADTSFSQKHKENTENYIFEVLNYVNAAYRAQSIHIVVVRLETWRTRDLIPLGSSISHNLDNLARYQSQIPSNFDLVHMLTNLEPDGSSIGLAFVNGICSFPFSSGLSTDYRSESALYTAMVVTHEVGHNLGLDHMTSGCSCPSDKSCIMSPRAVNQLRSLQSWSDCSLTTMHSKLKVGETSYCLKNVPSMKENERSICGNGIVEKGEDCDIGMENKSTKCCDMKKCTFVRGAQCASGACCNKETCQVLSSNVMCRGAADECDKVEYCNGISELCPVDTVSGDGTSCDGQKGTCYNGVCGSHDKQCKWLFGQNSSKAIDGCYYQNMRGSYSYGLCEYMFKEWNDGLSMMYSTIGCLSANILCGSLHCQNGKNRFWDSKVYKLTMSNGYTCMHSSHDSHKAGVRDPTMVPNGAICGPNKVCVDSKCITKK